MNASGLSTIVSLGELTIKKLMLKDLGLHLTIKMKPQPQSQVGSQSHVSLYSLIRDFGKPQNKCKWFNI